MTQALARAHLNSSNLIRFLTENGMTEAAPSKEDVGQKLGDWLNFRQAIALHGVLGQEAPPEPAFMRRAAPMKAEALHRHVDKVRASLAQSIAQGAPTGSCLTRIDMPPAELDEPIDPKTAYEPYRRFHAAHQRQMENVIRTLRAQVRGQVAKFPALQQLAALDAEFENILNDREAVLLGKVAKLLERRFAQALKQHTQMQADSADEPRATTAKPLAWLMPLRQELRSALLAELDTRLQPTLGLLEAFNQQHP
jgi:hypothetical protein